MTNWKYNVYLADLFQNFEDKDDNLTTTQDDIEVVIKGIYQRLLLLKEEILKHDEDPKYLIDGLNGLDNIINDLQYFNYKMDFDDQIYELNQIIDNLYDFSDYHYVWINTFDKRAEGIGKP